jgi:hypothetical protein
MKLGWNENNPQLFAGYHLLEDRARDGKL